LVRIAVLDDYQHAAKEMADWSVLPPDVEVQFFDDHLFDEDAIVERLKDFDIVQAMRERTPFTKSLMQRLPKLKLVATTAMINRAIDMEAATELGIVIEGTDKPLGAAWKGGGGGTIDLTWGLIVALTMNIVKEDKAIREGKWQTAVGTSLSGKTLGVIGLGGLGAKAAAHAPAFGMDIIAWSQNMTAERAAECGATLVTKDELFAQSDVITIHYVLTERSVDLVGARELALMKPTAYLINTSRGFIVNEAALIDTLERRAIAGAGIDTFDQEPLSLDHPFRRLDNIIVTPHIGYVTRESYEGWFECIIENISGFFNGKYLRVMNPAVLSSTKLRGPSDTSIIQSSERVELKSAGASTTYETLRLALTHKEHVIAYYGSHLREICPHIIGEKNGRGYALFYQFAGTSDVELGPTGSPNNWVCAPIDALSNVWTRTGPWHSAPKDTQPTECFDRINAEVDA
jgi:phosphoglycerate dehydrogenase-like enzyme